MQIMPRNPIWGITAAIKKNCSAIIEKELVLYPYIEVYM
jgi:hypothetical protein